jgi:uracil-DNA glycosylase family protein
MRRVEIDPSFHGWQEAARALLRDGVPPEDVEWRERGRGAAQTAVAAPVGTDTAASPVTRVPRAFVDLARAVAGSSDPERWALLYRVLWRVVHGERDVLAQASDPDVTRLRAMEREQMSLAAPDARHVASAMPAGIGAAPGTTSAGLGSRRVSAGPLFAESAATDATSFIPAGATLDGLRQAGQRCQGCDLHRHATQMVFGRGPTDARVVLVGEQPGDQEDLQGAPFVGPAGEVLDRALVEAGLDRERLYVTNVVKHFKFVPRGKRRIHQTPGLAEIMACRPWLEAELALIQPSALVCLGATAAQALLGPDVRVMRDHGRLLVTRWAPKTTATIHPSAVLRGEDEAAQLRLYRMLVDDLKSITAAG